jgi:hypothetical protein
MEVLKFIPFNLTDKLRVWRISTSGI